METQLKMEGSAQHKWRRSFVRTKERTEKGATLEKTLQSNDQEAAKKRQAGPKPSRNNSQQKRTSEKGVQSDAMKTRKEGGKENAAGYKPS